MKPTLVIMVKEPHPGRVKTRLGKDIGLTTSAWWFRHQTKRLLRRIQDPRWDTVLAVSPETEGLQSRIWPAHLPRVAQGRGNLGDRMRRLMRGLPPGPVAIIGADIPGISRTHIADAFKTLGSNDAVFGPAPDGGYWLVGLKRSIPPKQSLFSGVRWSSEHALADTIATLPGYRIRQIATLQDVDTVADLDRISA
ncbi:MAG: TIGR04282 family arsenosugar biosynthesis glycosyltransferase [Pseudoruegeria sp.]